MHNCKMANGSGMQNELAKLNSEKEQERWSAIQQWQGWEGIGQKCEGGDITDHFSKSFLVVSC